MKQAGGYSNISSSSSRNSNSNNLSRAAAEQNLLPILNYNIDGLGEDVLFRGNAVVDIILAMKPAPAIICLQEVVEDTRRIITERLSGRYQDRSQLGRSSPLYFTMIFTRTDITYLEGERRQFRCGSEMGRDLLSARVLFNGRPIVVYTSHLESCSESARTRCMQFAEIHRLLTSSSGASLFCGDTNLKFNMDAKQDEDAYTVGAQGMELLDDAYKASGANAKVKGGPSLSTTWCRRNVQRDNKKMYARFDRFYSNKQRGITVVPSADGGFCLVGRDDLPAGSVARSIAAGYATPSDHYGVQVTYKVDVDTTAPMVPAALVTSTAVAGAAAVNSAIDRRQLAADAAEKRSFLSFSQTSSSSAGGHTAADEDSGGPPPKMSKADVAVAYCEDDKTSDKGPVFVNLADDDDDEGVYPCPSGYDETIWETLPEDLKKELSA
jgi:endonuclease/exonuclease/phosphatase family metal-dependent hydrolase